MRKYKVTKWVIQSVSVGYETIIEADFKTGGDIQKVECSGGSSGCNFDRLTEEAEKIGHWDKIHDQVLRTDSTTYDIVRGAKQGFEWNDELVAEFALESTRGSYGLYSGCKTREEKLERYKDLKISEFVPSKHQAQRAPSSDKLGAFRRTQPDMYER